VRPAVLRASRPAGEQGERRERDRGGVGLSVLGVDDAVAFAPEHVDRDVDGAEPVGERRVGHGRARVADQGQDVRARPGTAARRDGCLARVVEGVRPELGGGEAADVGQRVAVDHDADPVDDHRTADSRALLQGDLGGQPAAERVADHGDVGEVELFQQRDVRPRQFGDAGQARVLRGAAEAGVRGQQHPGVRALGEQVGEAGHRGDAATAVQEQERPGAVAVLEGHLDRAERAGFGAGGPERAGRGESRHGSFSVVNSVHKEPYIRFLR